MTREDELHAKTDGDLCAIVDDVVFERTPPRWAANFTNITGHGMLAVIEKMRRDGWIYDMGAYKTGNHKCHFVKYDSTSNGRRDGACEHESLPRAVAIAAVLAVEGTE